MKLTPEEINIRIAELRGWKRLTGEPQDMLWPNVSYVTGRDGPIMKPPGVNHRHGFPPPNYFGSLDEMHEAEKTLTDEQWMIYGAFLGAMGLDWTHAKQMIHAEASQKAVFFLWTHGQNDVEL